jgi:hypothetical protein
MSLQASSPESRRLLEACEMHDVGMEMLRQRFRREHPALPDVDIEAMVRAWVSDRPFDSPGRPVTRPIT